MYNPPLLPAIALDTECTAAPYSTKYMDESVISSCGSLSCVWYCVKSQLI